jgi:ubiquinone/menaquinone biosynthesis C-methylase UbiE
MRANKNSLPEFRPCFSSSPTRELPMPPPRPQQKDQSIMTETGEADYVLGTNDEELDRLGLQHRVWRPTVLECWRRAGITFGSRVIDVGAGPGYATVDLAELVGPTGEIVAVERSARFLEFARNACAARGLSNVRFREADLMEESLGELAFDATWCRWVASFVSSPEKLIKTIAGALRPGGVAIFHEYSDYETFRVMPIKPALESFMFEVMASWRASGGEPNIAREIPRWLAAAGLRVVEIRPHVRTVSPRDYTWQWPASFVEINVERLRELGRVTPEWAAAVLREFKEAEANAASWFTTPMFLEIIARRE